MIERIRIRQKNKRRKPNRMTFTDLALRRLKPPKKMQELYWDKGQRGLSLLVSPGGTKTFRSTYKLNGQWLSRSIGRFGEMVADADPDKENVNITEAHKIVQNDRALAKKNVDPKEATKTLSPKSYEAVVDEFIKHYAKPRQRTWDQTERVLKNHCSDWLKWDINSITKQNVRSLLRGFVSDGHGAKAAITRAWLKKLWRWAYAEDLVNEPIMEAVSIEFEKKVRGRVYSDDEIRAIWNAATELEPLESGYIKLMLLLAPRKTALAWACRSHLDSTDGPKLWTVPFELTKSRKNSNKRRTYLIPLPPLAQRVIKRLPMRDDDDDRLFPGFRVSKTKADQPQFHDTSLKNALIKHGAPRDFHMHAVRHTIATWLQKEGHSEWEIGLVLNHSGSGVTAGYSHSYPTELKRTLLEKWANHIASLVGREGVALLG